MKTNNFIALKVGGNDEVFPIINETEKAICLDTHIGNRWLPKSAIGKEYEYSNIATIPDSESAYFISPHDIKPWFAWKVDFASGKTWHWYK